MDDAKLLRITELTKLYNAKCIHEDEKAELVLLQKEWLLEQSPSDINIQISVAVN